MERNVTGLTVGPVEATEGTFAAEVERSPLPVLVDFWAPWCGPCRMLAPVLAELATDLAGRVKIVKVNVDEHPGLAGKFGVRSIPTLLLFRGGEVIHQMVGAAPKATLQSTILSRLKDV